MANTDFGPKKQELAKRLLGALIDYANEEHPKERPAIPSLKCGWKESKQVSNGREELVVSAETLHPLKMLIRYYERAHHLAPLTDAMLTKELGAVLHRLADRAQLLELRTHSERTGPKKEGWAFTLRLVSQDHDRCLYDFSTWCEQWNQGITSRRPKGSKPTSTSTVSKPTSCSTIAHNLPVSGTPGFTGREADLQELQRLLQSNSSMLLAVVGMPGIGKTELVLQYANRHLADYPGGICWIYAREFEVEPQIVGFAQASLGLSFPEGMELRDQVAFCLQHWREGQVLLVFDDLLGYEQIRELLRFNRDRFHIVITTRIMLSSPVTVLSLPVFSPESSIQFLETNDLIGTARIANERAIANRLCEWLGYLPLGLELVGRYLNQEPDVSLTEMLFRLETTPINNEILNGDPGSDETWSLTARRGVAAAFELSWAKLQDNTQRLACVLGLFELAPITWDWVESVEKYYCQLSEGELTYEPNRLRTGRRELMRYHLLKRTGNQTYLLHSLVRKFFQLKLEENEA
ncbi:NB-ARC domain-containing protein [Leptolyngbya sp. PL-A3]|uniref:NB-ARC domain-containing protein n=1 Tax=Leptolyngbya sp. PL-A3 TaxID=2933911 RepID=UPI003299C7AC